jgi:hypothetical protein
MKVTSLGQVDLKNITREIHGYEINPYSDEDTLVEKTEAKGSQKSHQENGNQSKSGEQGTTGTRTFSSAANDAKDQRSKGKDPSSSEKSPTFSDLKSEFRHFRDMIGEKFGGPWRRGSERHRNGSSRSHSRRSSGPGSWSSSDWEGKIEGALERIGGWFSGEKTPDTRTEYEKYRDTVNRKFSQKKGSIWGSLSSFLIFGGLAFVGNTMLGWGAYPWYLWVWAGWGSGVVGEIFDHVDARRRKKDIDSLPELSKDETANLKEYHKAKAAVGKDLGGLIAVASIMGVLTYLHGFAGGWWIWLMIPVAITAMSFLGKIGSFFSTMGRIGDRIKGLFSKKNTRNVTPVREPESALEHAKMLKENILEQAKKHKETKELLGDDIIPLLDTYVNQIGQLSLMEEEVAKIINEMPMKDLEKDEVRLQMKREKAKSPALVKEYDKSIAEIDRQRQSFDSLKEQKEIISLRMNSSINSLKQMQIDIARMRSIRDGGEGAGLKLLREKSQELHDYIEDFQEGLREL